MTLLLLLSIWLFPFGTIPEEGSVIIVNKQNRELTLLHQQNVIYQAPVAVGKTKELTPEGLFKVKVMAKDPYYRKLNIPGGDPSNPLGSRWIGFDARGTDGRIYGLHGTNQPTSIGQSVSAGCIRLHNSDVEKLFQLVEVGTDVYIADKQATMEELYHEWLRAKWGAIVNERSA